MPEPSGFVSLAAATTMLDVVYGDETINGYRFVGGYYNELTAKANLELNMAFQSFRLDPYEIKSLSGDAILFVRDSDSHALGGFVSAAGTGSSTAYGVGAEGALFKKTWTIGASAGWFDGGDLFDSLAGACGYGRLYGIDRFAVEGRLAAAEVDYGGTDSAAYSFGGGAEYQIAGSPLSLQGDVDYAEITEARIETTTFKVGGVLHFGTRDLKQRDRSGAGMRGGSCLSSMPRF